MVNTTVFNDKSDDEYKAQARANWSGAPCGGNYTEAESLSPEFFRETMEFRYRSHPWILENIRAMNPSGKRVLEIGYGMGSDHLSLAREGAEVYGVDLTPRHTQITQARFCDAGEVSRLTLGDGECLPFGDDSFDAVYSFGVIHHSPNTDRIVAEIRRVLKPGGHCHVTVYHKHSVFFAWSVYLINYLWRGGRKQRSLQQQLSLIEYPNNNPDMVIRLYTRAQMHDLFKEFGQTQVDVRHLLPVDIELFSRFFADPFIPRRWLDWLGRRFGWYLVVEARK